MQKTLLVLSLFITLLFNKTKAQCVLVPLTLNERVNASILIVEAKVTKILPYWNADKTMIYTANTLAVSKVYKGMQLLPAASFEIITLGGSIGDKAVKVEPELTLELGEIGIFLLIEKNGEWVAESGPQGFIKIDKADGTASDVFKHYHPFSIYNTVENLTQKAIDINPVLTKITISSKRASPSISSISPKTINAGTTSTLTIKGTNFNSLRDTSSVMFKNGDDGGASFVKALKRDYISWSDTMIKVNVRSSAGTGKIRVLVGGNGLANSTDTLKIPYSHLNSVSGDSIGYETQEIGMNGSNGITWKISKKFADSTAARAAFIRSLERWRCGTYINWDTLGKVGTSVIKSDGINNCAWDTSGAMPSGVLAQCFSYWNGCFVGPTLKLYVSELDIRFRLKPTTGTNWNYSIGSATGTQYHFETVATHELGHGHQLGHVIAPSQVMHYSIANGQVKANLTSSDINGGNYVIGKSATAVCGKSMHAKLNSGNCAIVPPSVNFSLNKSTICLNQSITFTDSSKGNITNYSWDFDAGSNPSTASSIGPHTVAYLTNGTKTITLTITLSTGAKLVKTKTVTVKADATMKPNFTWVAAEKGNVVFGNLSNNSTANKWYFGDSDSSGLANPAHLYTAGGTYNIRLVASNTCNTEDTIISIKFAYLNFYNTPNNVCIGQKVTYFDSSDNNVVSWQWAFPAGTPATANTKGPHTITYDSPGTKNASLTVSVTGSQNQTYNKFNTVIVSTDTFVKASFTYGYIGSQIVAFTNNSLGNNMSYKWYFGNGDSSSLKNPVYHYSNANNKVVRLVVTGNCNTDDTTITLRDFTRVYTIKNSKLFRIYPNPGNQYFNIISSINQIMEVKITDISGKLVLNTTAENNTGINISSLANGIYLVKISADGFEESAKLVIQH